MDKCGTIRVSLVESGQVSVALNLNDKAKNLASMTKMDLKNCRIKHYVTSIDAKTTEAKSDEELAQLTLAREFIKGNYREEDIVAWPSANVEWKEKITDFNLLSAIIIGAYKQMFSKYELEERDLDTSYIDATIVSRSGSSFTRVEDPPKIVTVVIDGKYYRLVDSPISVPDPIALNLQQQQTAYQVGLTAIRDEHNRGLNTLKEQVAALASGQRIFPNWYSTGDYYDASVLIGLLPYYHNTEYCAIFVYPSAAIKFVTRGDVIKELKDPIPYPPLLVKVFINGNRFKTAAAFNMSDIGGPFGSFHITNTQCCIGDIKFAPLTSYKDLKEWYQQLLRGMLQTCNLGSPYHPTYRQHEDFYEEFFPGGGPFTWPKDLFKDTKNVVSL